MAFFTLSGYVITESNFTFYRDKTKAFLTNRFLRIIPPYFAALLASIGLHALISWDNGLQSYDNQDFTGIFEYPNLIGNFLAIGIWRGLSYFELAPHYYFVRYIWAVIVELQFYLLFAAVQYFSGNDGLRKMVSPVSFILVLSAYLWQSQHQSSILADFQYAPYFCLGICLYFALEKRNNWAVVGAAASSLLAMHHFYAFTANQETPASAFKATLLMSGLCFSIIPLTFVRPRKRWKKLDQAVGQLTYPLYLNHFVIVIAFASYFSTDNSSGHFAVSIACVAVSILFASAMNFVTEPYTKQIRDRVRGVDLSELPATP